MDRSRVALIIPAYNEADSIAAVVSACVARGCVVVVDDGSRDATAQRAAAAGAYVVSHAINRGYDAALDTGFAAAARLGCDYAITLDADGQHDPLLVERFIDALELGADIVAGVRPGLPRAGERLFAALARWRFGVRDPMCGMKAYRMVLYQQLGHFDSYRSIGSELLLHAASHGARVVECAVPTRPRVGSSRFGGALLANWRIVRAMCIGLWRFGLHPQPVKSKHHEH